VAARRLQDRLEQLLRQVETSTGLDIGSSPSGNREQQPAPTPASPDREAANPRAFIASVEWIFASTMPENPHWYVVEREVGSPAFDAFVALIQDGRVRRYKGYDYPTVTVDDFDYWLTRGNDSGWIINRKPSAEAGWDEE
jgi:hypothetical protein